MAASPATGATGAGTVTQRIGDAVIGLALAALGVWGTWVSAGTGLGHAGEPGPGAFPAAVCVLLTLGGLACALRAWRSAPGGQPQAWIDATALKALVQIALLCLLFVPLGMPLAGFLFVAGMVRSLGQVPWRRAALVAAVTVLVFWLLFDRLLSVQLPYGLWLAS
jgi:putative tricarboxylic transport membrane protein